MFAVILAYYFGIQIQIEQNHCNRALIWCQSSVLLQIEYTGCLTQKIKCQTKDRFLHSVVHHN